MGYNNSWYTFGGVLSPTEIISKEYSPFGEQINDKISGYGYNGEYYDASVGMLELRARFYDPTMNRFLQKDILKGDMSNPLSLNRYLYVENNPVNFVDPSGMFLDTLWNGVKSAASNLIKGVTSSIRNVTNAVGSYVGKYNKTAGQRIIDAGNTMYNSVQNTVNKSILATENNYKSSMAPQVSLQFGDYAKNGIRNTSAVQDMIGDRMYLSKTEEDIIRKAQDELDALQKAKKLTPSEFDRIVAEVCTALINDENTERLKLNLNTDDNEISEGSQTVIHAYTDAIDSLLERKTSEFSFLSFNTPFAGIPAVIGAVSFYDQVRSGGVMDVKVLSSWKDSISDFNPEAKYLGNDAKFVYRGELLSSEMLGNRTFGYLGRVVGFPDEILYIGGGFAKNNTLNFDPSEFFGDDADDHYQVKAGIEWYYSEYGE